MIENTEFCVTSENVEVHDTIFFIKNFKGLSEHPCMHACAHKIYFKNSLSLLGSYFN